jgi:heat shock protein HspQ
MSGERNAKFGIGEVVIDALFDVRAVIFDVDPQFSNNDAWWQAIPEGFRPDKDQPYYHLLSEKGHQTHVAYAPEAHLVPDHTGKPVDNPHAELLFARFENGRYYLKPHMSQ